MNWHEIICSEDITPTPGDDVDILLRTAKDIWRQSGCPEDFRVWQKTTPNYSRVIYFNPEARRQCSKGGLLSVGRRCNEPVDPGVQMIP